MKIPTKIPTLVALFLLVALVIGVSTVSNSIINTQTQASRSVEPKNVTTTNISDTGFTMTWTTPDSATGALSISSESINKTVYDQRDTQGKLGKYQTHSVTLRDGKVNTKYTVKILSNGKTFLKNGKPYEISTAPLIDSTPSGIEPAFGTVTNPDNSHSEGTLVYLTLEGSQQLSTLVSPTGSWIIPLNTIRSFDYLKRLEQKERIEVTLSFVNALGEATALCDTLNDSPVPDVTIGKSYDFRKQQATQPSKSMGSLAVNITSSENGKVLGEQTTKPSKKSYPVAITQPDDNASLISNMPLFTGTGVPGKIVTLTIGIKQPTTVTTSVGIDGIWKYSQTKPLGVGRQSITASTVDNFEKPIAITHVFDVLKSGTQVLGDATPSATLTPVITSAITPTLTPTFTPTPTSTLAGQNPPTTGTAWPTVMLIVMSVGLLLGGVTLSFK
jgi:hypothetical protein